MKKKHKDILTERFQFAIKNDDLMEKLIKEMVKPEVKERVKKIKEKKRKSSS